MNISKEAEIKIKAILEKTPGKMPRLILKKGGCAGNMLVLVLETPSASDKFIEHNGIKFAIENEAAKFTGSIAIELKLGLCEEIIVKNNDAQTCRCGKSFRIS